ncbi:ribonuclease Z [Actinocorallia herbida]|uniref:Ribonuclease Z n=1 Tax=Actinocorallia herbida TaxID=58109 RepID=A0A3N1CZV8_9ACTN|nr:MBL fold metallo-hydrolase [Actinocorallia herbida]ROO86817.1 ribonuclease Z [Actinocorallia herbida]
MRGKRVRIALAVVLALVMAVVATVHFGEDAITEAVIRAKVTEEQDRSLLEDKEHIQVLLCGTGSPEISAARAQACTLVAAGGKMFLFDAGEGATKSLADSDVPVTELDRVFLTHFHSDHFNGLATLVSESWIWGRKAPLPVWGPVGTEEVVTNLGAAYALDNGYREEHMGPQAENAAAAQAAPNEIEIPEGAESVRVYDEGGITIDARLVDHEPVEPAFGYVMTYRGKKVFVSGDTKVTPRNLPAMQDADLVVHEAYAAHLVRRALPIMREEGLSYEADVAERTIPYHADTIELAKQAQQAHVKRLALTHLTPWPDGLLPRRQFVAGMSDHYAGEITLGKDGLLIVV